MSPIYLDNNATTAPAPAVLAAVQQALESDWANPSSVHRAGQAVRHRVEEARAVVARLIGAPPRQVVFTSGGTESDNLALSGVLGAAMPAGSRVLLTTALEHSAIRGPARALAAAGVRVVDLAVDGAGQLLPETLQQALREHATGAAVTLLSVQWANNETGVIQSLAELGQVVRAWREAPRQLAVAGPPGAPGGPGAAAGVRLAGGHGKLWWHVDATQAVGKVPVDVAAAGVDLLTLSAHKFHGPKGVGALYVRAGTPLHAQLLGGPQERERRGGTENVPGIMGMAAAAELAEAWLRDKPKRAVQAALRDQLERAVTVALPDTVIHGAAARERLWNTTNLGFPGLEAEAILLGLSERGVYASAGAACSSGSLEPSPVLLAMGVPPRVAHGSVRFSLSRDTTAAEVDEAAALIIAVVTRLRRIMPVG